MSLTEYGLAPQAGDIVSAFIPVHYNRGQPGPARRLCLVLGLEVDEARQRIEGLWMIRLSERMEKVRDWDYVLDRTEIAANGKGHALNEDFVIRTPRIDLLPFTADYMGELEIHGHVRPVFWDNFVQQLRYGQDCSFTDNDYGPRDKLPHTVVKTSLLSDITMSDFDYESVISVVSLPPICQIDRADHFTLARREQNRQQQALGRMIHADFMAALRTQQPWSYADYSRTRLPQQNGPVPPMA